MKFSPKSPPRSYPVGTVKKFPIYDCGTMQLNPDEQVTFVTPKGGEYDVSRKDWGFYATPSTNGRLQQFGFRTAVARNTVTNKFFVMLVENEMLSEFEEYLRQEKMQVVFWLDDKAALDKLVE